MPEAVKILLPKKVAEVVIGGFRGWRYRVARLQLNHYCPNPYISNHPLQLLLLVPLPPADWTIVGAMDRDINLHLTSLSSA
jgi:hypothetical protein